MANPENNHMGGFAMHIGWSFLDKRKATINAIEAYKSMEFIIQSTTFDILQTRTEMEGVGSPNLNGMPKAHNTGAAEDRMLDCIDEMDTIRERYRQAVEFMAWFKPAWKLLSDEEQYILEAFYVDHDECAITTIMNHFCIERTSAYNRKNRSLDHLATLLYGSV